MQLQNANSAAYLFDIKITRQGKKNSARLDLYQSGDTISFFARGYLGKGVLKGLLISDSVTLYFPTEDEYFIGRLTALTNDSCLRNLPLEELILKLFKQTALHIDLTPYNLYMTVLSETNNIYSYRLQSKTCSEGIVLAYSRMGDFFVVNEIKYNSPDNSFKFEAKKRECRLDLEISTEKLKLTIPETAVRIDL
jgi:hypothetical protein